MTAIKHSPDFARFLLNNNPAYRDDFNSRTISAQQMLSASNKYEQICHGFDTNFKIRSRFSTYPGFRSVYRRKNLYGIRKVSSAVFVINTYLSMKR
jgi:hypothetical protein